MMRRTWDRPPRLEILPLIDVVFLLLVVFLYSMMTMVRSYAMPVDLPELGTGQDQAASAVLVISLDRDGTLYAGGEAIEVESLAGRLTELRERTPELQVFLNADGSVEHRAVTRILDELRAVGQERVMIVGRREDAE